ncbi:Sodium-dependent phosphate transport protein 2A [Orchesella cincta]|uniref:Sodium-dependent phosphate transport protein 2A n=1 Tax=Orchesella cincta TaxID=48709 RepID=A0A1D2N5E7_ORCCI|nr:Sodium-dependent phosphate transport protein 2A [Orchesella cincta]
MSAMLQVDHRNRFRRAFAAATIHDMFNWCTTLVLLPLESLTGYLYHLSDFIVREISNGELQNSTTEVRILKALTGPLTKKIVRIDKKVVAGWIHPNETIREMAKQQSMISRKGGTLFDDILWSDIAIGLVVVVGSFVTLFFCLIILVKILNSILKGLTLTRFCMKLHTSSNIGTTTTGIIAALAQTNNFFPSLQVALCHFLFNFTGVLLFFPFPCMRFPIRMAKSLGNTTAEYRWFAIVYIVMLFFLFPLLFMGLAFAGNIYVLSAVIILVTCFLFVVTINDLRQYPRFLPKFFHTWKWLPLWLRSLEPYDNNLSKFIWCRRLQKRSSMDDEKSAKLSTVEKEEKDTEDNDEEARIILEANTEENARKDTV